MQPETDRHDETPGHSASDFTPRHCGYSLTEAGHRALDEHAARIPYRLTDRAEEALRALRGEL